nr:calcium/proton exchanger [uncultured Cupriavidus sp.]
MRLIYLLIFFPIAIAAELFAPHQHLPIFVASAVAILPLAQQMGHATESLAERLGESVGGLLNATFGNAAELIIALVALRAGLHEVVEASIVGSIVGNLLLVFGAAMLAGGSRYHEQHFNPRGARSQATMLILSAIALILPAAFETVSGASATLNWLSVYLSIALLLVYALYLVFSLVTHPKLFLGVDAADTSPAPETLTRVPVSRAMLILVLATAGTAWMSEILVGSITPMMTQYGLSNIFVGAFLVAILGNAAEHATAITAAMNNRMDLSFSIAVGSSVQVALFVAPVLVLASLFIGPVPMDLAFRPALVLVVILSVVVTAQMASDGYADWFKGMQLLVVYFTLALTFFFFRNKCSDGQDIHFVDLRRLHVAIGMVAAGAGAKEQIEAVRIEVPVLCRLATMAMDSDRLFALLQGLPARREEPAVSHDSCQGRKPRSAGRRRWQFDIAQRQQVRRTMCYRSRCSSSMRRRYARIRHALSAH